MSDGAFSTERSVSSMAPKGDALKFSLFAAMCLTSFLAQVAPAQTFPSSFAYVLQADQLAKSKAGAVKQLAACERDWIVLDAAFGGEVAWDRADIAAIRAGRRGRKVIAYISIGEAEDYRAYWHREWVAGGKRTAEAPPWLGTENPQWKGNYRVQYWQPEWQKLICASVDRDGSGL
jgi:cysteinyl-tRNA synthetase